MKIGIFGGSFNPPHYMHKNIGLKLIEKGYVDKIIYVPTGDKYNKNGLISFKHRLNMLNLMTKNNNSFIVSNIANDDKYQYTYQVLDYYKKIYKDDDVYFICGTDNLSEFSTWKNYEYTLKNYKLLVIKRNNDDINELLDKYKIYEKYIIFADIDTDILSSTYIRSNIDSDEISKYIDEKVLNYIRENKLYRKCNTIKKIKLFTNNKTIDALKIIETKLIKSGFEIVDKNYDLAIAVGGDGTFLRMLHENKFSSNILYVGINLGTLGFSQDVNIDEIDKFIDEVKNNKYSIEEICIGDALIITEKKKYRLNYVNEIVIRNEDLRVIRFDINIGGNFLEKYVGDALLISTSFGSTAENLSYNGSVVYNCLPSLQITPIGPINSSKYKTLKNSIIVPYDIELKFDNFNIFVIVDGNKKKYNSVSKIITRVRDEKIKILRLSNYNYESKLNVKMIN